MCNIAVIGSVIGIKKLMVLEVKSFTANCTARKGWEEGLEAGLSTWILVSVPFMSSKYSG